MKTRGSGRLFGIYGQSQFTEMAQQNFLKSNKSIYEHYKCPDANRRHACICDITR